MPRNKAQELAVQQAEAQVEIIENHDKILAPYTDGLPYNEDRIINEVEFFHRQLTTSAFEVGKRLIVLKEHSEHGTFATNVLSRVHITPGHASGLMAFARTVVETCALSRGHLDLETLSAMDHRKVLMLGEIVQQNPEELAETGRIGGRTIEDWEAKSRKEIKAEIESLREQLVKGQELYREQEIKRLNERDRIDARLSSTPNAVTKSVTRFSHSLRDALASFDLTAKCDEELPASSATVLDLVGMRAELRTFYDQVNGIIEQRFPAVLEAEVPTDMDLTGPATMAPLKTAKVIDTQ